MSMKPIHMEMPERLLADVNTLTHEYGRFYAEPLESGYGITLGNALRRVLLSSLPGAAITAARIEGVAHEFSTMPNVVEDVAQIVLNLKEIRFKVNAEADRFFECRVEREGEGEITAANIQMPAELEAVNPDQHIAYLNEGASFQMTLDVAVGHGFQVASHDPPENRAIGVVPVDAIYSPVRKVNFNVEATRVGHLTDYERLVLEVWTDGAMTPKEALTQAAGTLIKHLEFFCDFDETYVEEVIVETPEQKALRETLDKPVAELELPVRAANCMESYGIRTVRDLVVRPEKDMLEMKNFGKKSLQEVREILQSMNLEFGMTQYKKAE